MNSNSVQTLPSEDERLRQAYHRIVQRARLYAGEPSSESESGTENENDQPVTFFDVEPYIYSFQDKINHILADPDFCVYLKIHCTKMPKMQVNHIHCDFGSNCCLMVSISFNYVFAKFINKRKLCENDMDISAIHKQTHQVTKLLALKSSISDDDTDDIEMRQLVLYNKFEQYKAVAFTVVSDLDLKDMSLWFKVGYLDYTYVSK